MRIIGGILCRLAPGILGCMIQSYGGLSMYAQSAGGTSGTLRGLVLDPSAAAINNATVEITNPVAHFTRLARSDGEGRFVFGNLPFNNYHLTVTAQSFQTHEQDRTSTCGRWCRLS